MVENADDHGMAGLGADSCPIAARIAGTSRPNQLIELAFGGRWLTHSPEQRLIGVNLGFLTERCRTPSWCLSARFSNCRAARDLKIDDLTLTSVVSLVGVRTRR